MNPLMKVLEPCQCFYINSHCDHDLGPKTLKFKTVEDKRISGTEECFTNVCNNNMCSMVKE